MFGFLFIVLLVCFCSSGIFTIPRGNYFLLNTALSLKRFKSLDLNSRFYFIDTVRFRFSILGFKSINSIYKIYDYSQLFVMPFIFIKFFVLDVYFFVVSSLRYFDIPNHFRLIYSCKILFKVLYESFLYFLLKNSHCKSIYAFDKEDRYSICTFSCIDSFGKRFVVFPHGLEYGFQLPSGVAGHIFFCLTEASMEFHQNTYNDNARFKLSKSLVAKVFKRDLCHLLHERRLIFFPESRDLSVNIYCLEVLQKLANVNSLKLYVCPLEKQKKYYFDFLQLDHNDVSSNDFVVARKSTVLFEYAISGLVVFALLLNDDDCVFFNLFPSLKHRNIIPITTIADLNYENLLCSTKKLY